MARVLLVDDNDALRLYLEGELRQLGHTVTSLTRADRVVALLEAEPFDVVLCDNRMPGLSGLDLLDRLARRQVSTPVIIMTGHADARTAIEGTKRGAFEYVVKPLDFTELIDELVPLILQAQETAQLTRQVSEPGSDPSRVRAWEPTAKGQAMVLEKRSPANAPGVQVPGSQEGNPTEATPASSMAGADLATKPTPLLGNSRAMRAVCRRIGQVAPTDLPVLITGETGTGKEMVARAICEHSRRRQQPLVAINCAAIPETLLESELFGHERGAFTGADRLRVGKFEQANGGTLLFDEIGDMAAPLQAKLLRALQEREIVRLGASRPLAVNVRVIACTHRHLESEVRAGRFREDLFHRLNGLAIELPPLRERLEDLPLLAEHYLQRAASELGRPVPSLCAAATEALCRYPWPGNIRELQNVLRRAVLFARGGRIQPGDLALPHTGGSGTGGSGMMPAEATAPVMPTAVQGPVATQRGSTTGAVPVGLWTAVATGSTSGTGPAVASQSPAQPRAGSPEAGTAQPVAPGPRAVATYPTINEAVAAFLSPPAPATPECLATTASSIVDGLATSPSDSPRAARMTALARELARLALDANQGDIYAEVMQTVERELLRAALAETAGNKAQVAKRLGLARNTVTGRIQTYDLTTEPPTKI